MKNTVVEYKPGEEEKPDVPDKPGGTDSITSSKYTIKDDYISKIAPGESISGLKSNLKSSGSITIKDKNGNQVSDEKNCATGMTLTVGSKTYTLIVTGDIDGNGRVSANDLAKLKLSYIGKEPLSGVYNIAADIDGNGRISLNDIAKIKLVIIGKDKIE